MKRYASVSDLLLVNHPQGAFCKFSDVETEKAGLLKIIADLQDEISDRDEVIESLESFCKSEIRKMPQDYVKHKQVTIVDKKP